jgi:uncharacterized spore protein YtfJ
MRVAELLKNIGDRAQSGATVKSVYGEPISRGDRTVIPVARISYGFGGGGSLNEGEGSPEGGGGGGGMHAAPAGVIEITDAGTHFIPFPDWPKIIGVAGVSLAIGYLLGSRRA